MSDLILPIGRVVHTGVPRTMQQVTRTAISKKQEAFDLLQRMGWRPDFKPQAPILIWGADNQTPILLMGDGVTEAAELQDMALQALDTAEERMKAQGRGLNYDELREKHGYLRREDVSDGIKQAFRDRIKKHHENPITDPFRQPQRALGASVFSKS